jgi:hypothetical protein
MVIPPKNYFGICDFCTEVSNCAIVYVVPKIFSSKISNIILCKNCLFELSKQEYIYIFEKSKVKTSDKKTLTQKIKAVLMKFSTFFQKSIKDKIIESDNLQNAVEDNEIMCGNDTSPVHKRRLTHAFGSLRKFNLEEDISEMNNNRRYTVH